MLGKRYLVLIAVSFLIVLTFAAQASSQTAFFTDNSDVTPRHHLHFEFRNQFDVLQRANFPNLRQNPADFELDYGLFPHVEFGIEAPMLMIISDSSIGPRRMSGVGDTNLCLQYNFQSTFKSSTNKVGFAE